MIEMSATAYYFVGVFLVIILSGLMYWLGYIAGWNKSIKYNSRRDARGDDLMI